jgi:hypothetical protein
MSYDFELDDLKRKTFNAFGDDASVELNYNFGDKVFSLQVPTKRIYLAGLTYRELKFYVYGYLDAIKEAI